MARVFSRLPGARVIRGGGWLKLKSTFRLDRYDLLYVESSTNRLALVDYLCLIFLRIKSRKMIVYIRDVYFEAFPESYGSFRGRIRHFLNRLTNIFYVMVSDMLGFPTLQMGGFFQKHNSSVKLKNIIAIPPGTALEEKYIALDTLAKKRIQTLKFIYVGGVGYKFSGIEKMLNFIERCNFDAEYFIVTRDSEVGDMVNRLPELQKNRVRVLALDMKQTAQLIEEEAITFAIHPRPRNAYDDMTYPIKFFDYISWLLPVLTDRHGPLVDILGEDYGLYCDLDHIGEVMNKISTTIEEPRYLDLLSRLNKMRDENLYEARVEKILMTTRS